MKNVLFDVTSRSKELFDKLNEVKILLIYLKKKKN
jgi:hypothetical protein